MSPSQCLRLKSSLVEDRVPSSPLYSYHLDSDERPKLHVIASMEKPLLVLFPDPRGLPGAAHSLGKVSGMALRLCSCGPGAHLQLGPSLLRCSPKCHLPFHFKSLPCSVSLCLFRHGTPLSSNLAVSFSANICGTLKGKKAVRLVVGGTPARVYSVAGCIRVNGDPLSGSVTLPSALPLH